MEPQINRPKEPIRQNSLKLNKFEMDQSRKIQTEDPSEQRDRIQMKVRREASQYCIFLRTLALFKASRLSSDKSRYSNLPPVDPTKKKLIIIIHTLITCQLTLVALLAFLCSRLYKLLSIQTVIIKTIIQAPSLSKPIWTKIILREQSDSFLDDQLGSMDEMEENQSEKKSIRSRN